MFNNFIPMMVVKSAVQKEIQAKQKLREEKDNTEKPPNKEYHN
jgi:hypothetical protein